jgi:dienelactone hydrolase
MKIPRDMRALARQACGQGWVIGWCAGGHLAWRSPAGALVVSSASPRDQRAVRKLPEPVCQT